MSILSIIAPRVAAQREAWRQTYNMLKESERSYDAGKFNRANKNWIATNESAEMTDRPYRDILRARARDLERNSDLFMSQVHPWIRNVVGKGYVLEVKTENSDFNKEVKKLWDKWCKAENCDVHGVQSFWEMARMAIRRKKIDGGILFVQCYTEGGLIPFKLQALEVDELDDMQLAPRTQGNKVVGGIEYNDERRPVGYWFKEYDIEGHEMLVSRYVPAKDVIFYFSKSRPSQLREVPEMAHILSRIKEVNGYIEAATVKERMAACLSVFIKSVSPTPSIGQRVKNSPDGTRNYNELRLAPGMVTNLNAGDSIEVVNPSGSATDGNNFIKTMSRLISAGQGVSYEAASRDLTQANYSSARQATIEDEETFVPEIEKIKTELFDVVYEAFLTAAIYSGALKCECPNFESDPDIYTPHQWNAKPKKWIDPIKETNANKTALETGQKTFTELWAENGRDYKDVMDEMLKIQEYAEQIGLHIIPNLKGGESK